MSTHTTHDVDTCIENTCMCTVTHTHTHTHSEWFIISGRAKSLYGAVSIGVNRGDVAFSHQPSINLGNTHGRNHTHTHRGPNTHTHTVQTRHPWWPIQLQLAPKSPLAHINSNTNSPGGYVSLCVLAGEAAAVGSPVGATRGQKNNTDWEERWRKRWRDKRGNR